MTSAVVVAGAATAASASVLPLLPSSVAAVDEACELLPLLERRFLRGMGISRQEKLNHNNYFCCLFYV